MIHFALYRRTKPRKALTVNRPFFLRLPIAEGLFSSNWSKKATFSTGAFFLRLMPSHCLSLKVLSTLHILRKKYFSPYCSLTDSKAKPGSRICCEQSLLWFRCLVERKDCVHQFNPKVREDPNGLTPPPFGHCPFGGLGLNACPDGLGHLLAP